MLLINLFFHGYLRECLKKLLNLLDLLISPILEDIANKEKVNGSRLVQDQITYTSKTIVNIYIVYGITEKNRISSYPTLENCFFGAVKLTKNTDIDKYKYSGYGIGFHRKEQFSFGDGFGQNVIILVKM